MTAEVKLPEGWKNCQLIDLGFVVTGKTPSTKITENFGGEFPFIKPGDLDNGGFIKNTADTLTVLGLSSVPELPPNSITVTCIGNLGKVGITTKRSATNQQINSVIPSEHLSYKFLYHQICTLKPWLEAEASATTVAIINKGKFSKAPIKLPPLAEQKVIADKLDTLLAQVESTKARLERIPQILKRFRQSVLAAAVSGKLTEEWHNKHDIDEWQQIRIEDVTTKVGSGATPKGGESAYKAEGVPLIRSMNVVFFGFKRQGMAFLDSAQAYNLRGVEVQARDVLLNITGASIGRVTIAPNDMDGARVNQHVCIIRPKPGLLSEFLCWFFAAPEMQRTIGAENYGATRQALTKQQILDFEISLPPIEEQTEIIRHVEQLFAYADTIEHQVQNSLTRVNSLTQSILAKAFRGELTEQWRTDNPELISGENSAEALLEKIKAERKALAEQPKKRIATVKKKTGSTMSKGIIKVTEALRAANKPLTGQELMAAAGYPSNSSTEQLEQFFLDVRDALETKQIIKLKRDKNGQDWFSLNETTES